VLTEQSDPALARPEPTAASPRRGALLRKDLPVGAALACGWLIIMLAHLRLPYPSDQLNYMTAAARFPHPVTETTEMHQVTRFGLVVPARLAIALFGYSQAAYHVVPVLATLTLLLGTYAAGSLLFARPVGAAGAVVVVAATPVFRDSTDLLPDVLAAGLFTVALAMAVAIRRGHLTPGRGVLLSLGLLLGWSYLVREFIVFVWPLVAVLVFRRVRWPGLLWVAAPIAALGLAETLLCWAVYGDALARLRAVTGHGSAPSPPEIASTYRDKPRRLYLLRLPATLDDYPEGAWLVLLLRLTVLGGVVRPRRFAIPAAWCALLWIPLSLLGGVIDPSAPKLRLQLIRYWFPIFPAFVLGGLGVVWLTGRFVGARMRGPAAARRLTVALPVTVVLVTAALAAGTSARGWWASPDTRAGGETRFEGMRSWLSRHGGQGRTVWADERTSKILEIYRHGPFGGVAWPGHVGRPAGDRPAPAPGDLVLFFDTERGRVCGICRRYASRTWGDPPRPRPGWRRVYASADGMARVYLVSAAG
jgi:hypothetical protein